MPKPTLLLIATGGTIAGHTAEAARAGLYQPGVQSAQALVEAVPELSVLARIMSEQPYSIGSEHLRSAHWMLLARRVRQAQQDPQLHGIVITHGTDTLEETALVLDLLCPRALPVVLTGAMRPAGALSADGPLNLLGAVRTALDPGAQGAGVMVVMNDQVLPPDRVWKTHSSRIDAFGARNSAPLADLQDTTPRWHGQAALRARGRPSLVDALTVLPDTLPDVALISTHVDMDPTLIDWLLGRGLRAMVIAGTGHGTLAEPVRQAIGRAVRAGCIVVRASRVAQGPVWRDCGEDDQALGTIAAGQCTPHKARTAVSLALAAGWDAARIQSLLLAL